MVFKGNSLNVIHNSHGVSIIAYEDKISVNNVEVKRPKGMNINNSTVINEDIYIGGYKWIAAEKKFKRTFMAFLMQFV